MVSPAVAQAILNQKSPDILGEFRKGQEFSRQKRVRNIAGEILGGDTGNLSELRKLDPKVAMALAQHFQSQSAAGLDETIRDSRTAMNLLAQGDVAATERLLQRRLALGQLTGQNMDASQESLDILRTKGPDALRDHLSAFVGALGGSIEQEELELKQRIEDRKEREFGEEKRANTVKEKADLLARDDANLERLAARRREGVKNDKQFETGLRTRLDNLNKDFRTIKTSFAKLNEVATGTAGGDLALIFAFMKMTDPTSVVRESEFANAARARKEISRVEVLGVPVPSFILQLGERAISGGKLLPEQRLDFLNQGAALFDAARAGADDEIRDTVSKANTNGVSARKALGGLAFDEFNERERADDPLMVTKNQLSELALAKTSKTGEPVTPQEIRDELQVKNPQLKFPEAIGDPLLVTNRQLLALAVAETNETGDTVSQDDIRKKLKAGNPDLKFQGRGF